MQPLAGCRGAPQGGSSLRRSCSRPSASLRHGGRGPAPSLGPRSARKAAAEMLIVKRLLPIPTLLTTLALLALACAGGGGDSAAATAGLAVQPASADVSPGDTVVFSATQDGAPGALVSWSVVEPNGGTVTTGGTYVAPAAEGTYTVVASGTSGSARATVVVKQRDAASSQVTVQPRAA